LKTCIIYCLSHSKGEHPVIYDYVWYQAGQGKAVTVEKYQVALVENL
jgi:hypothetical protein